MLLHIIIQKLKAHKENLMNSSFDKQGWFKIYV